MKKSGMEQRMEMYLQNVELGTENNRLNARIAELEAALEAKHQQYTGAVIQLEEARTHGEQYRKNWLALQAATGEDCQLHALDVIREARKDGERLDWLHKHMAHVFEWTSGKFGVESRSGRDHWVVKPIYDTPRAAIDAAREKRS